MSNPSEASVDARVQAIAVTQGGVVSRRELEKLGVRRMQVRRRLRSHRWQRVLPGTYAVFTGPLPPETRIWAAILYAGNDAVASHGTAAWLDGLQEGLPERIDVMVPHGRRHRGSRPGVRVRQSRHIDKRRNTAKSPPRTRLEETVLDLCDEHARPDPVMHLVFAATQRRLTTAERLRTAAAGRKRLRWRPLLKDLVGEVVNGVQSPLELRYLTDVEQAHGLPDGERNRAESTRGGRRFRDVRYTRYRTVVELDGRAAHPEERREWDQLRDNEILAEEDTRTLRYGWRSVVVLPCATAVQVAGLLRTAGWTGSLRRCGPTCTVSAETLDAA